MGTNMRLLSLLAIVTLQCLAAHAHTVRNNIVGRTEARRILNDLRQRHESHVSKMSRDNNFGEEEKDIDRLMLQALRTMEEENEESKDNEDNGKESNYKGGAKLIDDALKGKIDPNSDVVNLLESMFVDEGNRHHQHPDGIGKIARRKGKVFGDTHDNHKLTKQQLNELKGKGGGRKTRNFLTTAPLWPDNIIPYTIDGSLSGVQSNLDVINAAIQQFTDYTCLKWVPTGSTEAQSLSHNSYIEFFSESGCWSYVGRVFSDKQQISLQYPGCVTLSTTIHEMTHAIGQMHEQSRSDRDNHVTMLWANTQGGTGNYNMAKSSTHDRNPYDYESVLQYSLTAFSTNGQPTMEFHDRTLDFLADSATGLMFYDIQDITDAYDCTKTCTQPLKACQNGGFVIHTCDCHCPRGLTGTLCETPVTDPACGGTITLAEGETETLTTINFNNGGPYPTGRDCVWVVKGPAGKNVQMTIKEMDLTTQNGACSHWLEIQYNLLGQTGPRRCGTVANEVYVKSDNGDPTTMLLKFDSTFASSASAGKGFSLEVTSVSLPCKTQPCKHGTCHGVGDTYSCTCDPNYTGQNCDTLTDYGTISCGFEAGETCYFENPTSFSFYWTTRTGSTPSSSTGPSAAKTGTYYLYAETSSPVTTGTQFHYETPLISAIPRCLTFWYHMYGGSMGTLNVLQNGVKVWTMSGDQGDQWKEAEVDIINDSASYTVTFEAIRGNSWQSDIAIDDVLLTPTPCGQTSTAQPTTQAPTTQAPTTQAPTTQAPTTQRSTTQAPTTQAPYYGTISCGFEAGETCYFENPTSFSFYWTTRTGSTPSSSTGPSAAKTGTYYLYAETSSPVTTGTQFHYETPLVSATPRCLSFWYHMYGASMGTLNVLRNGVQVWTMSGDQGDQWKEAEVDIINDSASYTVTFEAIRGNSWQSDIAIDDVLLTPTRCGQSSTAQPTTQAPTTQAPTTQAPSQSDLHCTFEDDTCFLQNTDGDSFDWTTRSGSTPSTSTGPSSAYEGNMYSYIEATGESSGAEAKLQSSAIDTGQIFCLSFAYHMYGTNIGTLSVGIISGGNTQTLFSESGNQGNLWNQAYVPVSPTSGIIEFTAVRGGGFRSDIAIDDVHFQAGDCVIPSTTTPAPVSPPLSCTFEPGESCFLTQSPQDDFDWTSDSDGTPSSSTGPSAAFEGTTYAYTEATGFTSGQRAVLESSSIITADSMCLSFAYNMYGSNMGYLDVIYDNTTVFAEFGNKGQDWLQAKVTLPPPTTSEPNIQFIGTRGSSYRSDMAIDNIQVVTGECDIFKMNYEDNEHCSCSKAHSNSTTCEQSQQRVSRGSVLDCSVNPCDTPNTVCVDDAGTTEGYVCLCAPGFSGQFCENGTVECTFELGGVCFMDNIQSGDDDFDWTVTSGSTPSSGTGPSAALDGFFIYTEATGNSVGDTAILTSEQNSIPDVGPRCLRFSYNMYSSNSGMGTLRVLAGDRGSESEIWSLSGNQGDVWTTVEVEIPAENDLVVKFEGVRGSSYRSDIAIDSVSLSDSSCS